MCSLGSSAFRRGIHLFLLVWKFLVLEDESNTVFWDVFLIVLPVLFLRLSFLAATVWRLVDEPSTRFPRWPERLYMLTEVKEGQGRY